MDWTFLVLSAGVAALAVYVIPRTTRNMLPEVTWRTAGFAAAFLELLCLGGTTWEAYTLLTGFLFCPSVWILLERQDD